MENPAGNRKLWNNYAEVIIPSGCPVSYGDPHKKLGHKLMLGSHVTALANNTCVVMVGDTEY